MTQAAALHHPRTALVVPDDRRLEFLPALFGPEGTWKGESAIYHVMRTLCADYRGAYWTFYELDGKPLYMGVQSDKVIPIGWPHNGYEGTASRDAACIIANLLVFSNLSFDDRTDRMAEVFHRLREFASEHREANTIFRAID
ncbi:antirestriction protein [Aureimonas ureilytica]|uniref:antirestriction protein n=1 Tax=Aureimonas ureilytica TaxID=401562 RepID=UPI000382C507|nr:antirestriction protein [Aureimonas ureilytica]